MTKLTSGKHVTRISAATATHRGKRAIVVKLMPEIIQFRLQGTKTRYNLSIVGAFELAMKVEALRLYKEGKARREARREERRKLRRSGL